MEMRFFTNGILGGVLSLGLLTTQHIFGQTNLQFTGVSATDEGAIHLTWASASNEVYQIQCADSLNGNADGSTAWQVLYDGYPSQGTNTFIGDFGNYNLAPQILHPKNMSMRFYRVVDKGPDSLALDEPAVSILSPTNGAAAVGELTISVVAATDQPIIAGTKLYVDGQEMRPADSTTNWTDGSTNYEVDTYNINTCEWGNGTHTLFATAESESGYGDAPNSPPVMTGHAVSPFVSALFSNLVTRISFSQPCFDPSSGQTQQVSAVFAANCDWTLAVRDIYSNAVRTVTGSGSSMVFNWNGTGDGGTNLPTGIYYYFISAQTNGWAFQSSMGSGDSGDGNSSALALSFASASFSASADSTELLAMPADGSGAAVPLVLYPPGMDTNDLLIFPASLLLEILEMQPQGALVSRAAFNTMDSGSSGGFSPDDSGGSSASSQGAPASPQRPPPGPIVGVAGTFGIAYDTFTANGTNALVAPLVQNILGLNGSYIALDGYSGNTHLNYDPLPQYNAESGNFINEMQLFGWQCKIRKADDQLGIDYLRGSGTPFNNVSLGVFMTHGAFGNTQDYQAGLCKQMYFPVTSGGSIQYLRMSEMNLGGSDPTNGLKWFSIMACDSLHQANWSSMQSHGIYPYNNNLHLLLGANSVISTSSTILQNWAQYMNFGKGSSFSGASPMTIQDAWYQAARDAYSGRQYTNTMVMAITGDSACFGDYVQQGHNSAPQGSWRYDQLQVWP